MTKHRDTMTKHRLACMVFLAAVFSTLIVSERAYSMMPTEEAQPDGISLSKLSPWVVEHTADGAEAELLVVLADQADLSGAAMLSTKLEKGRYVYQTLWNKAQSTQGPILRWLQARAIEHRSYYIVNLIWVKGDLNTALALAARSDVARIEGNPRISNFKFKIQNSQIFNLEIPNAIEWNIAKVNADDVWAMGYTGQGVVVGAQDTGYDWDHPALINQYRGWDGTSASHDYNWHDAIHSGGGVCGPDSPEPCDDYGHGTHTAGTAVGYDGGTNQIGMAPGARWIGCRNMDEGYGAPATYLECFEFFLAPYPLNGTPDDGDPALAPDVTNNSWGCPTSEGCSWGTLQAAVEAQRAAGIMTVVSAGNEGSSGCRTVINPPSLYDASYTVGSINSSDVLASTSSKGPVTVDGSGRLKPDLAAPGVSIRSSVPGGNYQGGWSGTSMAAPHVAGAVALLWSAAPAMADDIGATEFFLNNNAYHISSSSCAPPSGVPNNLYGWGRLDIYATVYAALHNVVDVAVAGGGTVSKDPDQLDYAYGEIVTLTATADPGWMFVGWQGDVVTVTNPVTMMITGNEAVTATFQLTPAYTLAVGVVGAGDVSKSPDLAAYPPGAQVRLLASAAPEATFVGWSGDMVTFTNPVTVTMDENKAVTATFEAIPTYTLVVAVVGAGEVVQTPDLAAYLSGTIVHLTAAPLIGWQFVNWSGDLISSTNPASLTMNSNKMVTATFEAITYTLNAAVSPFGSGAVTLEPDQPTYVYGQLVMLTAAVVPGWTFVEWSGNLGASNPLTLTILGNTVVTATFAQDQYTLAVSAVGSGTVTQEPDQATYVYGQAVTLTAVAAPGWTFEGWSGEVLTATNPLTVTMDRDKAFTATFALEACQAITEVNLSIVTTGTLYAPNAEVVFEVNVEPDSVEAYTYTINYNDGTITTLVSIVDPLWISHTFLAVNTYTVQITAWNCAMTVPVTDVVQVVVRENVSPLPYKLYLPLVFKTG